MAIGIGISIANNRVGTSAPSLGSTMATTHYNRVIADGGVVPAGISGLTTILDLVVAAYGATSSSDFNTKVPVFLDPHYTGYKLGAGSGTTLGQAARTVYAISSTADVTQATAASQPLLLAHSGVNYWWGSGVAQNYVSTPISVITAYTNFEIKATVKMRSYLPTSGIIIGHYANANNNFMLYLTNAGILQVYFVVAGVGYIYNSTTSVSFSSNQIAYFKVTRNSTSGDVIFYTSTDGTTYNQLGTTISGVTGAITAPTTLSLFVGTYGTGGAFEGAIYRATIANSIGGSPVVDFNPASYSASTSQTAWTSSTGEVWTINTGTAATGYKGLMVDRTILQGDGIDDGLQTAASITLNTAFTMYGAFKGYQNEGGSGKSAFGKINIDGALFRQTSTILSGWIGANGGAVINLNSVNASLLSMLTLKRKVSDNIIQLNNGTPVTNTSYATGLTNSAIGIFVVTSFGNSNSLFNTGLISLLEDNTTQKTALYNTIRSMNNNAF